MKQYKDNYKELIIIQLVLCCIGLFFNAKKLVDHFMVDVVISCVLYVLMFYYFIVDYKKPHGNTLRMVVQIFGTSLGMSAIATISQVFISPVLMILACANINQMSARMGDREKNKKTAKVVTVILLIAAVTKVIELKDYTIQNILISLTQIIQWVTIMIAYVSRFDAHKEAGKAADMEKLAKDEVE